MWAVGRICSLLHLRHAPHAGYEALFSEATERLEALGGRRVAKFDFAPFAQTAGMLYQSAFIAERYAGERALSEWNSGNGPNLESGRR